MLFEQFYSKAKGKRSTLHSYTVKHSMLLNAITPQDRELLAVVKASEAFRVYLMLSEFPLSRDHDALSANLTST